MSRRQKIVGGSVAGLVLLTALRFFLVPEPHHHGWWHLAPFDPIYGFVGCVLIVYVSKALGKWFLQKPEDYYRAD